MAGGAARLTAAEILANPIPPDAPGFHAPRQDFNLE
jgi:hypothetical protein